MSLVHGKNETETTEEQDWWHVKDMFDFENIGFTHSVSGANIAHRNLIIVYRVVNCWRRMITH